MKRNLFFLMLVSVIIFGACDTPRYIYAVTPQNLPSLKKKGDFQVDAFYSTNGSNVYNEDVENDHYSNGVDGNAAVALTNHWAVTGTLGYRWERNAYSGYYYSGPNDILNGSDRYYRMNWELGTGYFTSVHQRNKVYLQLFGGVGAGRYSIDDAGLLYDPNNPSNPNLPFARYHDSNVFRFYLHPAVHFYFNDHFLLTVGAKMTNIHYSDIRTNYTIPEQINYRLVDLDGKTFTMFEPCIDMKFRIPGAEWIAPHLQFAFSTYLQNYDTRKANASFGISIMKPSGKRKD